MVASTCGGGASTRTLGIADSGTTVDLRVGQEIRIELEANPSTGFDWATASAPSSVLELRERTYTASGTLVGAAGKLIYRFAGVNEGQTSLRLTYARSFETVPPLRTFDLTVKVAR